MMFPAVGSSIFFAIVWYKNGWQKEGRSETYRGEKTDRKRRGLTGSDYVKIHSHGWKMMDSDSFRFRTYTSIQCVFFHRGRREGEYLNVNLCIYLCGSDRPFSGARYTYVSQQNDAKLRLWKRNWTGCVYLYLVGTNGTLYLRSLNMAC